ncbi:RNA methyltransferase [Desulfoplanes formicivorans]|uniref:tRNA (cytidine/uridine-2'-O-)-methyltransferase TrmJ n=1 Tax=Desulfoplanes formicivorans TaxID=1592317 RepID=A0A194AFH5_9BACT|nr:RNA methyltransferase [Desulfoplanes formicivorans]GAU07841.1 rRNA methyltransferase [Desulfoplanes formicivorans]
MNTLNTAVILVRPKYPENVGSVARACMNMGCHQLILVNPRNWDVNKAKRLATPHSEQLLDEVTIVQNLAEALAPFSVVYGTTARTGGWRKAIMVPEQASTTIARQLGDNEHVALVFGPEDTGLDNREIEICGQLICIPTHRDMTSLNLAQAVLIILYEIFKHSSIQPQTTNQLPPSRSITHKEQEVLIERIKASLLAIDFLHDDNPDYFMLPMRRFLQRFQIKRHEFNLLMGICRQVQWIVKKAGKQ